MSEKIEVGSTTIKHKGFFSMEAVLQSIQEFLGRNDFVPEWEQYKGKALKEYEVIVKGAKKVTDYVKWHVKVWIWVYDCHEVEIVKEGKPFKTQEGRFKAEITSNLELDWQNRFKGTGIFKKFVELLDDIYRNKILKYKIEDFWAAQLDDKHTELVKVIQNALGQEVA